MPRASDPRVTLRFSQVDHAMLRAAADVAGVPLGALVREGAVRYARELAGELSEPGRRVAPAPAGAGRALALDRMAVTTARALALERQRKLNERKP